MNDPVPARAHANMSVAERELTFDALLAEFGDDTAGVVDAPKRPVAVMATPAVLKLAGLIALAVLSLTLVFVALAR